MAREWTKAQKAAINEPNRTLLVSAAAGSGKTAVLTERIIKTLTDADHPADISRILVVTFTRAATGELRERIAKALSEALAKDPTNAHLTRQLMLLGGAHISTIDSFYLDLVRAHFATAGFPPTFRLADETELASLRREIMNDTVDAMYAEEPDFSLISDIFCDLRTESSLTDILLSITERLQKLPESIDALLRSAKEMRDGKHIPLETAWGKCYLLEIEALASRGATLFSHALSLLCSADENDKMTLKFAPLYGEIKARCEQLLTAVKNKDYPLLRDLLTAPFAYSLGRHRIPPLTDEQEAIRLLCEDFRSIQKWKKTTAQLGAFSSEEIADSAEQSAKALELLHETLRRYLKKYGEEKHRRGVAEFTDVSRAAFRLLVNTDGTPTPLAREISLNYDAIYIDEYQDTDAMQDAAFSAIATERNRFMVGDIKQSIYRFRGAEPSIFGNYRKRFPPLEACDENSPEATVFMSDCFRCDKSVIDFSNTVSGFLFGNNADSIGYTKEDDLRFSKPLPTPDYQSAKCRVLLVDPTAGDDNDDEDQGDSEARLVAAEIDKLLKTGYKADGTRITAADISVLMRSTKHAKPIANALAAYGIPTNDTSRYNLFESPEVLCVYSLLAAIDNPFRDVSLAAALRSPFFGFTLEELVRLRAGGDRALSLYESLLQAAEVSDGDLAEKVGATVARIKLFRQKARTLPVDRFLRYLYRETGVLSFSGYENAPGSTKKSRRANLNRLYEYARSFEAGGFKGLYQFVRYIDDIMDNGTKIPANEGEKDAVSLVSIHHSKGLEYPVCFIVGTASSFSKDDLKPALLIDKRIGCAPKLPNAGPFSRTNTFFRAATALALKRQSREEEMCVLYVAMTRARERLIITGRPQGNADKLLEKTSPSASLPATFFKDMGGSYLEWILTALQGADHSSFAEITVIPETEIPKTPEADSACMNKGGDEPGASAQSAVLHELNERFAFTYPHEHLTRLPAKLSVSRLSPEALDVFDSDGAPSPASLLSEDAERLLHSFERVPTFGKRQADAAARGTATHEFLQFCDFAAAEKNGVDAELARLIDAKFLPPEHRDAVRIDELEAFFKSPFYASLSHATGLWRETRFHIFLPAASFTKDAAFIAELGDEKLPVQGVIDLFYTDADGKLILCDYKTDRLTPAEKKDPALAAKMLSARHGQQLSYYARALQEICGRAPDRILIYSLPLGDAVEAILP